MTKFKKWLVDMKFRKKLFFSYILVSIIPIVILGFYSFEQARNLLVNQENQGIRESLRQAVTGIDYKLETFDNLSDYMAFNNDVLQTVNQDYTNYYDMYYNYTNLIDPLFNNLHYFHNDISKITIYSSDNIAQHGNVIIPINSIQDKSWYGDAEKAYSPKWLCDNGTLFSARRIVGSLENAKNNILYIEVSYTDIFNAFKSITSNDYGIYVVDDHNRVIYQQNSFRKKDSRMALRYAQAVKLSENNSNMDGLEYTAIVTNMQNYEWKIIFYKPINSNSINANKIILVMLLVIAVCFTILFLIIRFFSYAFVRRIELLTDNMRQVESGRLRVHVFSNSQDEIGELIRSFGTMIEQIENLIREVYESKIIQRESEMKALQAQINPHFLYNSLSLINWKAIRINAEDISRMAQLLATFYRTTLNKGKNVISIHDELENTKSYVDIQSMMHSGSFDVEYDFDNALYNYQMINLVLQPIVENAIEHGLDHKLSGRGNLKISGRVVESNIRFCVEDNGIGIDPENLAQILRKKSKGYGLKNVHDRIRLFYGDGYGVEIESRVNEWTRVSVVIPKRTEDDV